MPRRNRRAISGYVQQVRNVDGAWVQLDGVSLLAILRDPAGWTPEAVRVAQLTAARWLEERFRTEALEYERRRA